MLSGYSNPTSRLFHLPYKAKARSFPLLPGSLKSSRASPEDPSGVQPGCEADGDGKGGTGVSPAESTAEKAGAFQRRSVTVSYES